LWGKSSRKKAYRGKPAPIAAGKAQRGSGGHEYGTTLPVQKKEGDGKINFGNADASQNIRGKEGKHAAAQRPIGEGRVERENINKDQQ